MPINDLRSKQARTAAACPPTSKTIPGKSRQLCHFYGWEIIYSCSSTEHSIRPHLCPSRHVKEASSSHSTAVYAPHIQLLSDGVHWHVSIRQDKCSLCGAWAESKWAVLQRCTSVARSCRHSSTVLSFIFSEGQCTSTSGSWNHRAAHKCNSRLHSTHTLATK